MELRLVHWTRQRWVIDTHVVDSPKAAGLRQLRDEGWVELARTDTLETETSAAKGPGEAERLARAARGYPEALGPFVVGHSRLDHAVIGDEEDDDRFEALYATVWPSRSRRGDAKSPDSSARTHFRDVMHVSTGIRYGFVGLVSDDKGLLAASERVAERYGGFVIVSTAEAYERGLAAARSVRERAARLGEPDPSLLPDWPA